MLTSEVPDSVNIGVARSTLITVKHLITFVAVTDFDQSH